MAVVISDRLLESSDRLLDSEPDDHLVRLVRAGHGAAFAAIVRRYERELHAQAHRLTSDGRGEDAVQQAFLNAFTAMHGGAEVRHLRGWLHQILRNEVTRARVPVDAPLDATVAHGETLEDTVQRRATAHAALAELSALPDRQRDALLGTAVFGFPRAHVARTMGLSEGAVRQLVHRARLRLRQAATALVPFPVVKFFGAARSGVDAAPDTALSAGTAAASGGLAIKVGALLASGVVATGIAVTHTSPSHHHAATAQAGRHHTHARVAQHISSRSAAPAGHGSVGTGLVSHEHAQGAAREDGHGRSGAGRLSGTRSGHDGSGPGRGHGSTTSGRGVEGSGGSTGGSPARGDDGGGSGSGSPTGSGSGAGSRSGSGEDGSGSGAGRGGSGSGRGHQGGSASGSVAGSSESSSGDSAGAGSSGDTDGGGHSSGGGGATDTDDDTSASSSPGSSGSTPTVTTTSGETSGGDGGASGSGSGSSGGSGSGGGQENSHESRDVSGSSDSSSS
jgi:RNA polymerase sigma factor (sigma-70 family)